MAGCSSTRRRCRPSSPSSARKHPLEDDDLLHEIFLRLPPQPPHRLRASLVSKRWRRLATDPKFLRRFCIHHRKPPLLGGFSYQDGKLSFRSTLDPPYRIPPERFSLQLGGHEVWTCLDCRHGRILFDNRSQSRVIVWDPVTDDRRVVAYPPQFHGHRIKQIDTGTVLCAAGDQGHVHGACHSSPFKVVALSCYGHYTEATANVAFTSVYSSETGIWSDLISTTLPGSRIFFSTHSTLVGNTLHYLFMRSWQDNNGILEFDLDAQRLAVIEKPHGGPRQDNALIIQAEDGGLGLAALTTPICHPCLQMWDRQVDSHGVATWVLRKTLELHKILGLEYWIGMDQALFILHYLQDVQAIFLRVGSSVYMLQLESMQSKELFKSDSLSRYHPFASFYAEGILE
ncbi:hypothetical protein QYE76_052746 [Lolium multiflorum]|uniref:F-box domain-containing protein n=1 Tax=Lolium multiflorum TaxID=4521 RepID=A0AAD8SUM6_LOLMU|nr:hypothetical protein QYE76_052746 [Lolium multiflorum]